MSRGAGLERQRAKLGFSFSRFQFFAFQFFVFSVFCVFSFLRFSFLRFQFFTFSVFRISIFLYFQFFALLELGFDFSVRDALIEDASPIHRYQHPHPTIHVQPSQQSFIRHPVCPDRISRY